MLDRIRRHLQRWLNAPSPVAADLMHLQQRLERLERRPRTPPPAIPSSPTLRRDLESVPDAHLGAH